MKSTVRSQTPPGLVTPGTTQMQRRAGRLLPEGELPPVLLLAEVPAVVAPEDDDRVVLVGRSCRRRRAAGRSVVAVGDGREVALHRLLPAARLQDRAAWSPCGLAILTPAGGTSSRSSFQYGGSWIVVEREHVVVLPRHVPRHVRLVQADGEEERLVVLLRRAGRCRNRRSLTRAGRRRCSRAGRT